MTTENKLTLAARIDAENARQHEEESKRIMQLAVGRRDFADALGTAWKRCANDCGDLNSRNVSVYGPRFEETTDGQRATVQLSWTSPFKETVRQGTMILEVSVATNGESIVSIRVSGDGSKEWNEAYSGLHLGVEDLETRGPDILGDWFFHFATSKKR